jgi:hypothetical protein
VSARIIIGCRASAAHTGPGGPGNSEVNCDSICQTATIHVLIRQPRPPSRVFGQNWRHSGTSLSGCERRDAVASGSEGHDDSDERHPSQVHKVSAGAASAARSPAYRDSRARAKARAFKSCDFAATPRTASVAAASGEDQHRSVMGHNTCCI